MAQGVRRIAIRKDNVSDYIRANKKIVYEALGVVEKANRMTPKVRDEIESLGFSSVMFRGFNSHSGDCFLYLRECSGTYTYYVSIGVSNLNQAGRGLEIEVTPTAEALKKLGIGR